MSTTLVSAAPRPAEAVEELMSGVCQIDPELNDKKFIVPGLGDAGDRIFNTLHR